MRPPPSAAVLILLLLAAPAPGQRAAGADAKTAGAAAAAAGPAARAGAAGAPREEVAGVPYSRQATREATLEHMLSRLLPPAGVWGEWYLASPFPYAGHGQGDFATPHAPEQQLAAMRAGGPGPDLSATMSGKNRTTVTWRPLGRVADQLVDLDVHGDPQLDDHAAAYLYVKVTTPVALTVPVTMGSDDGLRVWLNGALVHENDVARGLSPDDDHLVLPLRAGTNHLLVKVTEGEGDWAFQVVTRKRLDALTDAALHRLLDRDFPPAPDRRHWRAHTVPVPDEVALEVGGLAFLGDGRPVVATRRGDVWIVEGADADPPVSVRLHRFASGLHEPLGLAVRTEADGEALYLVQRGELTRLRDLDGDGRADLYETVTDRWGVSGNYHEFAFGPCFDERGDAWVTLNVGFCGSLGKSTVPWRGWALRVTPDGEVVPVCDGLRSPNGLASYRGSVFTVDNQGDWVATNRLAELRPGSWHGHPATLRWRAGLSGFELPEGDFEAPPAPVAGGGEGEADDPFAAGPGRPARQPPAVWFPYKKMGQSAADIAVDETGGAFGPFEGQLFVGDQTLASVMRVFLERVDGHWQGACFPFVQALDCGSNRLAFAPDGSLYVGQTDRGWASVGRRPWGLQRLVYTGETPFEILAMEALPDGFRLRFTLPVDPATALDPASYALSSFTYAHHADYGAPEFDTAQVTIARAELEDERTVRLLASPLRTPYVHELRAGGVRAAGDPERALLHPEAYYTLVRRPGDATLR